MFLFNALRFRKTFGLCARSLLHTALEATADEFPHIRTPLDMVGEVAVGLGAAFALLQGHQQQEDNEEKPRKAHMKVGGEEATAFGLRARRL